MTRGRTATIVASIGLAVMPLAIALMGDIGIFQGLLVMFVVAVASAALTARLTVSPPATRWDHAARVLIGVLGLVALLTAVVFVSFHCYEGPESCAPQESTRLFTPVSI